MSADVSYDTRTKKQRNHLLNLQKGWSHSLYMDCNIAYYWAPICTDLLYWTCFEGFQTMQQGINLHPNPNDLRIGYRKDNDERRDAKCKVIGGILTSCAWGIEDGVCKARCMSQKRVFRNRCAVPLTVMTKQCDLLYTLLTMVEINKCATCVSSICATPQNKAQPLKHLMRK